MAAEFEDVLQQHGPALWRVVASYAPPGAERDDLAQDVMLAVWQALKRFRGESSVKSFVLRIAHNRGVSNAWRRAKRQPGAKEEEAAAVADPRPGADERLAANERAERLMRHVRVLPLGQRQVLALALEGLTHGEISAVLSITVENVAVRLGRARSALHQSMNQEDAA